MQPTIFQPNNHSQWEIRYRPVPLETAALLKDVFCSRYGHLADAVQSIAEVDEAEINSNNFKVRAVKGGKQVIFLLRRYAQERDEATLRGVYEVVDFLRRKGLKVPEVIPADSGDILIASGGYRYGVFRFAGANHYRGSREELVSAAEGLGRLDAALVSFPGAERIRSLVAFSPRVLALREFSQKSWEEIFEKARLRASEHPEDAGKSERFSSPERKRGVERSETDDQREDSFNRRVLESYDFIMAALRATPFESSTDFPQQLAHIDLHPHNLLCDGRELVLILDFDSLRFVERMRAVAFALHRLARQHIVFTPLESPAPLQGLLVTGPAIHGGDDSGFLPLRKGGVKDPPFLTGFTKPSDMATAVKEAKYAFLTAYQRHTPLTKEENDAIGYFIRHEALSRLSYALKEFYATGESVWAGDLEKQTAAIAEAAYF